MLERARTAEHKSLNKSLLNVTERPSDKDWQELPFGAFEAPPGYTPPMPKKAPTAVDKPPVLLPVSEPTLLPPRRDERPDAGRPDGQRGDRRGRRGRWRDRERPAGQEREGGGHKNDSAGAERGATPSGAAPNSSDAPRADGTRPDASGPADGARFERDGRRRRHRRHRRHRDDAGAPAGEFASREGDAPGAEAGAAGAEHGEEAADGGAQSFDSRAEGDVALEAVNGGPAGEARARQYESDGDRSQSWRKRRHERGPRPQDVGPAARPAAQLLEGWFVAEKGGFGFLRRAEAQYLPSKEDIFVPQHLVQRFKLRDGSLVSGPCGKGNQSKHQLLNVETVDGKDPREVANVVPFKKLTSIDPDFHYAVGDIPVDGQSGDVSMRVLDVICPVGRGSRGLIVAPPRSGKTILMRKFAAAITEGYPDVHLMVLLIDERPEEATEWKRTTKGQVFVSTNDEDTKNHVELAEIVFKRCQRLVELGQDVVLLLDSITRLARAYNNHAGTSGKTMSGGLDSRAMERPRAFFGMARNTETAGSLTILGTTLVETGSRLDQMVFEEFKGTGNMEIVLSRKLADRRIFPAIDIERSGTRKDEKLHSATRLRRIHTLRRVLLKMNFVEAMELLISKLEDVDKIDDFLKRFETDPEA